MASELPKTPPPAEQQQPAYPMAYPATYPPAFATPITAFPPSFYTAPSPESGAIAIDANGILPGLPPGTQIMMLPPLPPGMVYAIPPPPPGQGALISNISVTLIVYEPSDEGSCTSTVFIVVLFTA